LLCLQPVDHTHCIAQAGLSYLNRVRRIDLPTRAASIASYEDEGLSRVFAAILRAPDWRGKGQQAFKYFLEQHIKFDSDGAQGHGALSRHLAPDDRILPLWAEFKEILITAAPKLSGHALSCPMEQLDMAPLGPRI